MSCSIERLVRTVSTGLKEDQLIPVGKLQPNQSQLVVSVIEWKNTLFEIGRSLGCKINEKQKKKCTKC